MGDDAEQLVEWTGNLAFMRMDAVGTLHKCAALTIDRDLGVFACSIYATRPDVCRELARGSDACHGELAAKSGRPKRALAMVPT